MLGILTILIIIFAAILAMIFIIEYGFKALLATMLAVIVVLMIFTLIQKVRESK